MTTVLRTGEVRDKQLAVFVSQSVSGTFCHPELSIRMNFLILILQTEVVIQMLLQFPHYLFFILTSGDQRSCGTRRKPLSKWRLVICVKQKSLDFPSLFIPSVMRPWSCPCVERVPLLMMGGSTFLLCCKGRQFPFIEKHGKVG